MSVHYQGIAFLLAVAAYFVTPVMLIWGWVRWIRQPKQKTPSAILSLTGFLLATASCLLAIIGWVWAMLAAFRFHDPRLLRIIGSGCLLSVFGVVLAVTGVSRTNSLRWHAVVCSLGTLFFWVLAIEGE